MRPIARALYLTKLALVSTFGCDKWVVKFCLGPGFFVGGNVVTALPFVFNDQNELFTLFGFADDFSGYRVCLHPPKADSKKRSEGQSEKEREK